MQRGGAAFFKQGGPGAEELKLERIKQEQDYYDSTALTAGAAAGALECAGGATMPSVPVAQTGPHQKPEGAGDWAVAALAAGGDATQLEIRAGRNVGVVWWELQAPNPGRQATALCCPEHGKAISDRHGWRLHQTASLDALAAVVQELKSSGELGHLACSSRAGISVAAASSTAAEQRPPRPEGLRLWTGKASSRLLVRPRALEGTVAAAGSVQSQPLPLIKSEPLAPPPPTEQQQQQQQQAQQGMQGPMRVAKLGPLLLPAGKPQASMSAGTGAGVFGGQGAMAGAQHAAEREQQTGQSSGGFSRGRSKQRLPQKHQQKHQLSFAVEVCLPCDATGRIVPTAGAKKWTLLYCASQQQRVVARQLGQLWGGLHGSPATDAARSAHATLLARYGEEHAAMQCLRQAATLQQLRDQLRELRDSGGLSQLAGRAAARGAAARKAQQADQKQRQAQQPLGQVQQQQPQAHRGQERQQQQGRQAGWVEGKVQEGRREPRVQQGQVVGGAAAGQGQVAAVLCPHEDPHAQVLSWGHHRRARRKQSMPARPAGTWRMANMAAGTSLELGPEERARSARMSQGVAALEQPAPQGGIGGRRAAARRAVAAGETGPSGKESPGQPRVSAEGKQRDRKKQRAANGGRPPSSLAPQPASGQGPDWGGYCARAASIGRMLLLRPLPGGTFFGTLSLNLAMAVFQQRQQRQHLQPQQGQKHRRQQQGKQPKGPQGDDGQVGAANVPSRHSPLPVAAAAAQQQPRLHEAEQAQHDTSTETAVLRLPAPPPSQGHLASPQGLHQPTAALATASQLRQQQQPRACFESSLARPGLQAPPALPTATDGACDSAAPLQLAPRLLECCRDPHAAAAGLTPILAGSFMACFTGKLSSGRRREAAEWVVPLLEAGQFEAAQSFMAGIVHSCGAEREVPAGIRGQEASRAGEATIDGRGEQLGQQEHHGQQGQQQAGGRGEQHGQTGLHEQREQQQGVESPSGGMGPPADGVEEMTPLQSAKQEQGAAEKIRGGPGGQRQSGGGAPPSSRKRRARELQRAKGEPAASESPGGMPEGESEGFSKGEGYSPRKRVVRERHAPKPWWIV